MVKRGYAEGVEGLEDGARGPGSPCPAFYPSKAEFSRQFAGWVRQKFREHPDLPMLRVVPPAGWSPSRKRFPDLKSVTIATPIKQRALLGTSKGNFQCYLTEEKELTAHDFRRLADSEAYRMPQKVQDNEDLVERAFWSSLTVNPPIYGADTPQSFFDEKIPWGWNLRNLSGDLLRKARLPEVVGVTTPMTYWGMWRAFFSWHVEDKDLYSINYLHFGAPKMWYCIPPSARHKFEEVCQNLFPENFEQCPAFLRHKNIMLSPAQLRQWSIPYVTAKQRPGEFIVLNSGAYHCGFNLGFNCAEAINFATPEWIPLGRVAEVCECKPDTVRIDMRKFKQWCPNWDDLYVSGEDTESDSDEEGDSEEGSRGGRRSGATSDTQALDSRAESGSTASSSGEESDGEGARPSKRPRTSRGRGASAGRGGRGSGEAQGRGKGSGEAQGRGRGRGSPKGGSSGGKGKGAAAASGEKKGRTSMFSTALTRIYEAFLSRKSNTRRTLRQRRLAMKK